MEALSTGFTSRFIIRNWRRDEARIDLRVDAATELVELGEVRLQFDRTLIEAWRKGNGDLKGIEFDGETFLLRSPEAFVTGLLMRPRQEGAAAVRVTAKREMKPGAPLVSIRQLTDGKEDGGVDLALSTEAVRNRDLPDLIAAIDGPAKLQAGLRGRMQFAITVTNQGAAEAPGTADNGDGGYRIGAELWPADRKPGNGMIPDDSGSIPILVGRGVATPTLKAGEKIGLTMRLSAPRGTAPGRYCLAVKADAGDVLAETDEANNESCLEVEVVN